ncbi:MAG: hypothetical protein K0B05_12700 [Bacteroidales bacterium]|nr:hypothetical protein [Bacteroidales bacterium]
MDSTSDKDNTEQANESIPEGTPTPNEPDYDSMSFEDIAAQYPELGKIRDVTKENEGKTYLIFSQKPRQDSKPKKKPPPDDFPITMDFLM